MSRQAKGSSPAVTETQRVLLSRKFGLRPKISQEVKSFVMSVSLRPNFGLSDR